jgi:hypothetical protein
MLDAVLEKYSVTPVTPAQNEVGQPEAAPLLGCTPVTPVTPQKNEMQAKWEKSDEPAPASEAAHNAAGRYFKWLITRPDGSQFYSCSMPRQTLAEVRAQYPDATHIQPVEGEDYPND